MFTHPSRSFCVSFTSAVVASFIAFSALTASPVSAAPTTKDTSSGAPKASFERFRKQTDPGIIVNDPEVKKGIRSVMGNKDEHFWECAQLFDEPTVEGNDLFIGACVRGLNGFMNSALNINLATGKICAGYVDDATFHIFGAAKDSDVPQQMKTYNRETLHDKTIVLNVADWTPKPKSAEKKVVKKLNLNTLTGTYERNDSKFVQSTLRVQQLKGNRIKFKIDALNGSHTGGTEGTVTVVNGIASYKEDDKNADIRLKFNGKKVDISGKDQYFCGMAVTLLGTYTKTDDKVPNFR